MADAPLVLLLPSLQRFAGQAVPSDLGGFLARADRVVGEPGGVAQLRRHVRVSPDGTWPVAALQADGVLPGARCWLRADPVTWRADLATARLVAWGNTGLSDDDADALVAALQPGFADRGACLHRLSPGAWCVGLAEGAFWPSFTHPLDALGDDAFPHLPQGPAMRTLRAVLGEAQVVLHQHPVNADRASRGLPPVNSLWFWGGGVRPERVELSATGVFTLDDELAAWVQASGATRLEAPLAEPGRLLDLRHERDASRWVGILGEVSTLLRRGQLRELHLDSADGRVLVLRRRQRWRCWRRPLTAWPP